MMDADNNGGNVTHPEHVGFYPAVRALWHLKTLGVIDDRKFAGALQGNTGSAPVRVAIIDTPVAWHHPNLEPAIDKALMRDFSVHYDGAFVIPGCNDEIANKRSDLKKRLNTEFSDRKDHPVVRQLTLDSTRASRLGRLRKVGPRPGNPCGQNPRRRSTGHMAPPLPG